MIISFVATGLASLPARPLVPRSQFSHLCSRHYSSLAWKDKSTLGPGRNLMARASLSVRYFWSKLSKLKELEDVANAKPRDGDAQLEYLQVCVCVCAANTHTGNFREHLALLKMGFAPPPPLKLKIC